MNITVRWQCVLATLCLADLAVAQGSYFFGADLAPVESEEAVDKMEKGFKKQGWKPTAKRKNVAPTGIKDNIKEDLASAFNGKTLKCNNGVMFVYLIAHGKDGNFGRKSDFGPNGRSASIQDLTTWLASTIPECCTLILGIDVCGSRPWQDTNFSQDGKVKEDSPLYGINCIVAMPFNGFICEGPLVGNAINKTFGQRLNTGQYTDVLGGSPGVRAISHLDDDHKNTPVTVPEPSSFLVAAGAMALVSRRRLR